MHVLAFATHVDSGFGGQEKSLLELCQGLHRMGAEISLGYQHGGNQLPDYQSFCQTVIPFNGYVLRSETAIPFVRDLWSARCQNRTWGWDVLYANQYFDIPFVASLGRWLRLPVVCHLRLGAPAYLSRQYRWGLNQCRQLVAISENTKTSYVAAGIPENRISVVYNAIDVDVFTPLGVKKESHAPVIVYLGRTGPEKGLVTLLRAFRKVLRDVPAAVLKVYGNERACTSVGFLDELKRQSADLLDQSVFFFDPVPDVRPLLYAADLLVLPAERHEAFGRVLIEAMACEIPVVATRIGGVPEVLAPDFSDHLVAPENPELLARKIVEILPWRQSNPLLGQRCREYVRARFSSERLTCEMLALLHDVTGSNEGVELDVCEDS